MDAFNIDKEIKLDLVAALNDISPLGVRTIHIVSPYNTGNPFPAVPGIWKFIKRIWCDSLGTYVQAIPYQAHSMQRQFQSFNLADQVVVENVSSKSLSSPPQDKLRLTWHESFREALATYLDEGEALYPKAPLIFFIDLERVPTIQDQVMIGLFITYLNRLLSDCHAKHQELDITVITLSATYATDVYEEFHRSFEADPKVVSTKTPRPRAETQLVPGENTKAQLGSCVKLVVEDLEKALNTDTPQARELCLVLFLSTTPEDIPQFVTACSKAFRTEISLMHLTRYSRSDEIDLAMQETKAKIICIDSSFPSVLPLNITHMVSSGTKVARLFDQDSSHIVSGTASSEFAEILWEDAWASASTNPKIRVMRVVEPSETPYERPERPLEGDLMYMAYHVARHWPSVPHDTIPIPSLRRQDSLRLQEMFRRLETLSLIQRGPDDHWTTVPRNELVPKLLYSAFNTSQSLQLACLISNTNEQKDKLGNKAVRILLRLAAIIDCGVSTLISVNEDQMNALGFRSSNDPNMIRCILSRILNDSSGTARNRLCGGALWLALGLWQRRFLEDPQFTDGNITVAGSVVHMNKDACQRVAGSVHQLERAFDLEMLPWGKEVQETTLNLVEVMAVSDVLLQTYIHQQVFFLGQPHKYGIDLVSHKLMDLSPLIHLLLDPGPEFASPLGAQGPVVFSAIYTSLRRVNGVLQPQGLVLIPNQANANSTRLHGNDILSVLRSCCLE